MMKRVLQFCFISALLFACSTGSAVSQTWTWVSGRSTSTIVPDFGTRGEFQPTDQPPPLENAAMWVGPDSNIYLFGGDNGSSVLYNTIWEYNPTLKEWMWKRGSNSSNAPVNYGTSGYPTETNDPGARTQFAWSAATNGDLWIYGGFDNNSNFYGDLWKYDFALDRWIWYSMAGNSDQLNRDVTVPPADTINAIGDAGARAGASLYVNSTEDTLWLLFGESLFSGSPGMAADFWRIDPFNVQEYWVAGPSGDNPDDAVNYSYFPSGVDQSVMYPGARSRSSFWKAPNGKFYLFGGENGSGFRFADFWSWNPSDGEWAWIQNGSDGYSNEFRFFNGNTIYYPTTFVGGRDGTTTWMKSDTQLVIYGGYGYGAYGDGLGTLHLLDDYWSFNSINYSATWLAGGGDTLTTDSLRPTFGTEGVAADSVYPGARYNAVATVDQQGRVWLFGGQSYPSSGGSGVRNDLWVLSTQAAGAFAGGDGTSGNPYQVATLAQLQNVGSYLDKNFKLTADIDVSATASWNLSGGIYRGFIPIGSDASPFTGTLDGNGHVITKLTINRGSTSAVGLIGRLDGSVQNVALDSLNIVGDSHVGGLTGRDLGSISGCSVSGTVIGSGDAVGGLAGDVYSGSIEKSYAAASVTGGVFSGSGAGGLAGSVSSGLIFDSYARGSVAGDDGVGGLVGTNYYSSSIDTSYSTGSVSGTSNVGGFVGKDSSSNVLSSFWDMQSSGSTNSSGGTGEGTSGMKSQTTFASAGWDFTTPTWGINPSINNGYPYLSSVVVLDNSLAVQATNFFASSEVSDVKLSWRTESEVDNAGFNVLRENVKQALQSGKVGGSSFSEIGSYTSDGTLKGLGTSSSGKAYDFTDTKVESGSMYQYKIQSVSTSGAAKDIAVLSVTVNSPSSYELYQNYPNPFNPSTTIRFDLKHTSAVSLEIYNTLGQKVLTNEYGSMAAGRYDETVNMNRFASGVYFYRIVARGSGGDDFTSVKKLVLMK